MVVYHIHGCASDADHYRDFMVVNQHPLEVGLRRRAFAAALAMPDADSRRIARAALARKRYEPKGEEFLLEFLRHEKPQVRAEAARTFGEMGKAAKKHVPRLRGLLQDPELQVRGAAKRAIAQIERATSKKTGKKPETKTGPGTKKLQRILVPR